MKLISCITCQKKRVLLNQKYKNLKKGGSKEKQAVKAEGKEDGKAEEPQVEFALQRKATRQIPDDDANHKHCKGSLSGSCISNVDEEQEDQSDEMEEQIEIEVIPEQKNILQRINERLSQNLIDPHSRKMKFFKGLVAITCIFDMMLTCLLVGNYHVLIGRDVDFLGHASLYFYINTIYFIEIIVNFFLLPNEGSSIKFSVVAKNYLKLQFWLDILTVLPYHYHMMKYIFLRFIRLLRYREYQTEITKAIDDALSDYINNELLKKLMDTLSMTMLLVMFSHFFACIWMLLGLVGLEEEVGWIHAQVELGNQSLEKSHIYVSCLFWIITSFSSVGYGDIKATTS